MRIAEFRAEHQRRLERAETPDELRQHAAELTEIAAGVAEPHRDEAHRLAGLFATWADRDAQTPLAPLADQALAELRAALARAESAGSARQRAAVLRAGARTISHLADQARTAEERAAVSAHCSSLLRAALATEARDE